MNKLYIIRHGKTSWNKLGLLQGSIDIELNEEGIKEVNKLKDTIDINKIDICISSPMKRCKQTSEIIINNKKDIIYDKDIIERNFGDYEGTKNDNDLYIREWDYKLNDTTGNIESVKDLLNRANNFLNKINKEYNNKTILIISHGSFIKALHYNIIGYNENTDFLSFNPKNTTIYEYDI